MLLEDVAADAATLCERLCLVMREDLRATMSQLEPKWLQTRGLLDLIGCIPNAAAKGHNVITKGNSNK